MNKFSAITLTFIAGSIACSTLQAQQQPLSQQMAATVMKTWPDSFALGKTARWSYDLGVILKGFQGIWYNTADPVYFNYIQKMMDFYVSEDGNTIKDYQNDEYNIDHVNNGKLLLLLYRVTGKEKYRKAAAMLREQLRTHPRTNEGGFWHKKVYPYQMWLDGLYMGQPFYAEYAMLNHEDTAFNDIANQFIFMENHARNTQTGLLYHGWDESKQQKWANKTTGLSPNIWGRAMGWYAMALVDVLDYFPENHPKREELIKILQRLTIAVEKVQDKQTGLWYDVMDMPNEKGNYFEASASSMLVYAVAKGVRKGYLPAEKLSIARKGYAGIVRKFIKNEDGQVNLHGTVKVSGLGGNPYRDGSFAYYMSEPVIVNDPKGVGAFLQAAVEMELLPATTFGKGKTVLLDNYFNREYRKDGFTGEQQVFHYVWDEMDLNGYSLLGQVFNKHGVKTSTLPTAPTAGNLAKADFYLIVDPDTKKETPAPNYIEQPHIDAITNWVKQGGVLILLGNDSINAEFTHFNKLAKAFGMQFNQNSLNRVTGSQFEMGAISIPAQDAVFKSAKKLYIKELSSLTLTSPSKPLLKQNGNVIMATAKFGKGTVFALGDPWLYNEYTDGRKLPQSFQNYDAANDLVKWLIQQSKKK